MFTSATRGTLTAMIRHRTASLIFALALAACGCTGGGDGKTIVLALDGLDPQAIDLLMSEGKLPNFAKLRQDGAYGRLESMRPILSPIIWTTIATGKLPHEHGIGHFVATNPQTGESLPVTSQMRKVKAIWNLASEADKSVGVVGWWATWPAETVNGAIVSDHTCYHFLFEEGSVERDDDEAGITYPAALAERITPLVRRPGDLVPADVAPYVAVDAEEFARPFSFDDDLAHFKWALATGDSYREIGLDLLSNDDPDLLMVYLEGVDSSSHLFGHLFRAEGLKGELAEQQRRYGRTVEQMYLYADRMVGEYMERMDDDTTLVVLSDHGFELGVLHDDPSKTRDMRRVSERYHRLHGILYLYGRGVRRHVRIDSPQLVDIAPTLLALLGIGPARDMPGRVLTEALDFTPPAREVLTFETGTPGQAGGGAAAGAAPVDPKILEHLEALGYLDADSPTGERNLAAMHFEAGRYAEAQAVYEKMVAADPQDSAARTSLAGTLAAQGVYDRALEQLDAAERIEPLNAEIYHNRAAIHERRGETDAAIEQYRKAVRYRPGYEPSVDALVRLTGSAEPDAPSTDAERLAAQLAARAREAALRGDYAAAMEKLDEATAIAPEYARIYQYRSNVAFLMKDVPAAIAALEKAVTIQPDNALFARNLESLRAQTGATGDDPGAPAASPSAAPAGGPE